MFKLTQEGKEDLALAILLLRDFKSQGQWNPEIVLKMLEFAKILGVIPEYDALMSKVPVMNITPRD